jgi:hypothetical protein
MLWFAKQFYAITTCKLVLVALINTVCPALAIVVKILFVRKINTAVFTNYPLRILRRVQKDCNV